VVPTRCLKSESFGNRDAGLRFVVPLHQGDQFIKLRQLGCESSGVCLNQSFSLAKVFEGCRREWNIPAWFSFKMGQFDAVRNILPAGESPLLGMTQPGASAFHGPLLSNLSLVERNQLFIDPAILNFFDYRTVMLAGPIGEIGGGSLRHSFHSLRDDNPQLFLQRYTCRWCRFFLPVLHLSRYLSGPTELKTQDSQNGLKTRPCFLIDTQFSFQFVRAHALPQFAVAIYKNLLMRPLHPSEVNYLKPDYALSRTAQQWSFGHSGTTTAHWQAESARLANGGLSLT
jgi:hypothetical protein